MEQSGRVVEALHSAIADAGGAIRFSRFMEIALYQPGLGYYSAGARKFGEQGDFVTAPEISPLYSRCLARTCAQVLQLFEGAEILEIGGGTGVMAADLFQELECLDAGPARYRLLEISADLRQRQQATIAGRHDDHSDRFEWLDDFPQQQIHGVIIANEVLDALPAERFRITRDGPRYLGVGQAEDRLVAIEIAADDALLAAIELIESDLGAPLRAGYESEFCPGLASWIARVAGCLAGGVVLFADYGLPRRHYYHPQRSTGTLMCHYRHRAHTDPFKWPGLQDITAWVDFTAVAEAGSAAGLTVEGFTSQASFLIGSGIADLVEHDADTRRQVETAAQIRRLTLPGEMGESFKLMGLGREWHGDLPALSLHDQSGAL